LTILLKLLLGHLLGDFVFQPYKWVVDKEQKKIRSKYLLYHILVHAFFYSFFLWDVMQWPLILCLTLTHYAIDLSKLYFQRPHNRTFWFFLDQALHLASIFCYASLFSNLELNWSFWDNNSFLIVLAGLLILTWPTALSLKLILRSWSGVMGDDESSLYNAGTVIGMLERLLVFLFVLSGHWEAIGFLIAAKSVFRFSDLKDAKDRKLTEYILIGTLISFGIALIVSWVCVYLLSLGI
jgi:hypothetical protein